MPLGFFHCLGFESGYIGVVADKKPEKPEQVEIRRAPKVLAFTLTGAVIGVVVAFVLNFLIPEDSRSNENVLGLLLVALGSLGLGLGVAMAIAVDLISSRKPKQATASRTNK